MLTVIRRLTAIIRHRWKLLRATREAGASTVETVILVALFAALAIAVMAIIAAKVTDKANSINLG